MRTSRLTRENLLATARLLREHLSPTPLVRSATLSERTGKEIWLKLETQHPTGSFKVRPALAGALHHREAARSSGLIASSSGNFAQGVAWATARIQARATIVMTEDTKPYKIERTRALGARIEICGPRFEDRWETVRRIREAEGQVELHPFNSEETVLGDATLVPEVLEQLPQLAAQPFAMLVPASGGGLASGISWGCSELAPGSSVIALQPERGGSLARSLAGDKPVNVGKVNSIADALVASQAGELPFELFKRHGAGAWLFTEAEILESTRWLIEEHKIWAEPAASLPIAALATQARKIPQETVVCVLTGGNMDPRGLGALLGGS